jgi:hypothetical protein
MATCFASSGYGRDRPMRLINGSGPTIVMTASVMVLLASIYSLWCITIDGVYYKPPVTYWEGCFTVTQDVLIAGEPLTVQMILTKRLTQPGTVMWTLVNVTTKEVTNFQVRQAVVPTGYHDIPVRVFDIPKTTPPGMYFARGMATYSVNPFKDISYSFQTTQFEVRRRDG